MNIDNKQVGNRLRMLRENAGWSQEEFAKQQNFSAPFICDLEKGRKNITLPTLLIMAEAFCVTPEYILFGTMELDSELKSVLSAFSTEEQDLIIAILKAIAPILHKEIK